VIEIHGERGKIGEVTVTGSKLTGSTAGVQHLVEHMIRKHGGPSQALQALASLNNGYVWAVDKSA